MLPESASQNLAASFDAVDFPLPEGPTSAVTSHKCELKQKMPKKYALKEN